MSDSVGATVGRVKWFNGRKGFGFISTVGTETPTDVFVHHSSVRVGDEQYKYLVEGEYVSFNICTAKSDESQEHQHQASDVTGVYGGKLMCETRNENRDSHNSWQGGQDSGNRRDDTGRHEGGRHEGGSRSNPRY